MSTTFKLKDIILNTNEPFIIKNGLRWELLNWDLQKWTAVLGNEELIFRQGKNRMTKNPQFENTTGTMKLSFKEFLNYQKSNPNDWLYFDYKYLKEWLINISELQKNIDWSDFGFPELNFKDSTIWIGSKGAHTPCHLDTYGCNLIAQIYGKKQWILFPPQEDLHSTRIPYEESSIYSKINFFSPICEDFEGIKNCRTVILNPGDVLILPHRWWHYVENLELAISINTWIKLPIDHEERIGEAIVHLLVSQTIKQLNPELRCKFLNPSSNKEQALFIEENIMESLLIVQTCLDLYKESEQLPKSTLPSDHFNTILQSFSNIELLKVLSEQEFKILIETQRKKFPIKSVELNEDSNQIEKVFDAILHNDVVNLMKQKLLENNYK